jgi:WD40 repeat protein
LSEDGSLAALDTTDKDPLLGNISFHGELIREKIVLVHLPDGGARATINLPSRLRRPTPDIDIDPRQLLAFSADARILAVGGAGDSTVQVWYLSKSGRADKSREIHTGRATALALSPDGTLLATGSDDHDARLWNLKDGRQSGGPLVGHTALISALTFSPDGKTLASGGSDGDVRDVRLWDVLTGKPIGNPLSGYAGEVYGLAFAHDGSKLAVGGDGMSTAEIWDVPYLSDPVGQMCRVVGPTLSRSEWKEYIGGGLRYENPCR